MNRISILVIVLFCMVSCEKGTEYSYSVEDQVYDCWREKTVENGYDISKGIHDLESVLIKHSILNGRRGVDYLEYCSLYSNAEKIDSLLTSEFIEDARPIIKKYPFNIECKNDEMLDASAIYNSRMDKLALIYENIDQIGELSMEGIGKSLSETFTDQDLNHNMYKHAVLSTTFFYLSTGGLFAEERKSQFYPYESDYYTENNLLHIIVNEKGRVIINDKEINISDLKSTVRFFIENDGVKETVYDEAFGEKEALLGFVRLDAVKNTPYESYMRVYEKINEVYMELWDEYAMEIFNKRWENLKLDEKRVISHIIPRERFIEGDPELDF